MTSYADRATGPSSSRPLPLRALLLLLDGALPPDAWDRWLTIALPGNAIDGPADVLLRGPAARLAVEQPSQLGGTFAALHAAGGRLFVVTEDVPPGALRPGFRRVPGDEVAGILSRYARAWRA